LNYLGYTYAEQGERLDEAEKLIRRALAIEPDDGFYIDSLGWVYYMRGNYPQAVEELERAIEHAGDDPTVTEHLGDAYEKSGKTRDAIRVYQEALGKAKEPEQIDRLKGKLRALGAGTRTGATES
jgi:tetratricopeptide (TPR) repeat protein